jgi:hypothetical protein
MLVSRIRQLECGSVFPRPASAGFGEIRSNKPEQNRDSDARTDPDSQWNREHPGAAARTAPGLIVGGSSNLAFTETDARNGNV